MGVIKSYNVRAVRQEERKMGKPKQFVYRYNGDAQSEEVEQDFNGDVAIPEKGSLITRKGKTWHVVHVLEEATGTAVPVVRVFVVERV